MNTEKTFNALPTWARGVIAIVVVAGVAYGGYRGYLYLEEKKKERGARAEADATKSELDRLNKDAAKKQTITQTQASSMANAIHASMDGYGTDWVAITKQLCCRY